jgi:hypothetical protein
MTGAIPQKSKIGTRKYRRIIRDTLRRNMMKLVSRWFVSSSCTSSIHRGSSIEKYNFACM